MNGRTRLVCLGETPSPRVRNLGVDYLLTYLLGGPTRRLGQVFTAGRL